MYPAFFPPFSSLFKMNLINYCVFARDLYLATIKETIMQIDFTEIIVGCKKNKEKYQELLYKQFYGYVMSIALRYAENREEAVEILNDTFMKIFRNINQNHTIDAFRGWLAKIAVNTAIDYVRKHKKMEALDDLKTAKNVVQEVENIQQKLALEHILEAVQSLPTYCRLVFNLYVIEGYAHKEIGDLLGITEATSRANLSAANEKLRKILQPSYKEYGK